MKKIMFLLTLILNHRRKHFLKTFHSKSLWIKTIHGLLWMIHQRKYQNWPISLQQFTMQIRYNILMSLVNSASKSYLTKRLHKQRLIIAALFYIYRNFHRHCSLCVCLTSFKWLFSTDYLNVLSLWNYHLFLHDQIQKQSLPWKIWMTRKQLVWNNSYLIFVSIILWNIYSDTSLNYHNISFFTCFFI